MASRSSGRARRRRRRRRTCWARDEAPVTPCSGHRPVDRKHQRVEPARIDRTKVKPGLPLSIADNAPPGAPARAGSGLARRPSARAGWPGGSAALTRRCPRSIGRRTRCGGAGTRSCVTLAEEGDGLRAVGRHGRAFDRSGRERDGAGLEAMAAAPPASAESSNPSQRPAPIRSNSCRLSVIAARTWGSPVSSKVAMTRPVIACLRDAPRSRSAA